MVYIASVQLALSTKMYYINFNKSLSSVSWRTFLTIRRLSCCDFSSSIYRKKCSIWPTFNDLRMDTVNCRSFTQIHTVLYMFLFASVHFCLNQHSDEVDVALKHEQSYSVIVTYAYTKSTRLNWTICLDLNICAHANGDAL